MAWDRSKALQTGRARTADGRPVFGLHECAMDGHPLLLGRLVISVSSHGLIQSKAASWSPSGRGVNRDEDLVDDIAEGEQATRFRRRAD